MEYSADEQRQAYVQFRQIFQREPRERLNKGRIKKLIKTTESIQPLRARVGHARLQAIVRKLLDDGIFDSDLRAWQEFPEFFPSKPPGDIDGVIQHAAMEACEGEGDGGSADSTDNELGAAVPTGKKGAVRDGMAPVALHNNTGTVIAKPFLNQVLRNDGTLAPLVLSELYLPYNVQHVILSSVQKMLEEACFLFAQRWLPFVLENAGFDCPAAVELTKWAKILSSHRDRLGTTVAPSLKGPSFPGLLASMRKLRNIAVHRIPAAAVVVSELVASAAELTEMLQDGPRAALMREIDHEIKANIRVVQAARGFLGDKAARELEEINRAREELDRREKQVAANMLREEADRRRELGQLLEQTVGNAIADWEAKWRTAANVSDGTIHLEALDLATVELGNAAPPRKQV